MRVFHYALFSLLVLSLGPPQETMAGETQQGQIEALKRRGQGTPAAFLVQLLDQPRKLDVLILGKKSPMKSMNQVMLPYEMAKVRKLVDLGIHWELPNPKIIIPYAGKKIRIDGKIEGPEWQKAYGTEGCYPLNRRTKSDSVHACWKLMWDETYLYIGVTFPDTNIIAPKAARDQGNPYRYDALEVFMMTAPAKKYWEVVVNPNGTIFDSLQTAETCGQWISKRNENIAGLQLAGSVRGTIGQGDDLDQSYTLELALPLHEIPGIQKEGQVKSGQIIRLNLVRSEKATQEKDRTFYSFMPLLYNGHNIDGMTKAILSKTH